MIQRLLNKIDAFSGSIEVIVRDVGHGNWNEIRFGNLRVFFDIGAQKEWGNNKIRDLVDGANIKNSDEIYIFISHWDVDHYQAILKMNNHELKQINGIFAPENIPDTNTVSRVREHLKNAGISIQQVPFTLKRQSDKKIELNLFYSGKRLKIYRATKTKSRNLDSLVFYIENQGKSMLLTGDQKYEKLYEYVINSVPGKLPMILVLPHHGGHAGNFDFLNWNSIPINEIVVSYNKTNRYGHPLCSNYKKALDLTPSKSIVCTNDSGNKSFYL